MVWWRLAVVIFCISGLAVSLGIAIELFIAWCSGVELEPRWWRFMAYAQLTVILAAVVLVVLGVLVGPRGE